VIATDKTGTLTGNRLVVSGLTAPAGPERLLEAAVLSADDLDPIDQALLRAGRKAGLDVDRRRREAPRRAEFPFDRSRRLSTVVVDAREEGRVVVKGAPEAVAARCAEADRGALLAEAERLADEGLRVIAFAEKRSGPGPVASERDQVESGLTWLGLVAFDDPPRPEAPAAIAACRAAGIRVLMVTGDHPRSAAAVARAVGPEPDAVVARATPEDKLRIVIDLQGRGERVAVTGDGVNDAPALAAADIGIAMGRTGTDVAREAADIVVADDDFATIVRAIGEGRILFANLRKAVRYYLSCKAALAAVVLLAVVLGLSVPFAPVQIIVMELFMDLAASAAFVAEPGEAGLMQRPPRDPRRRFLDRRMVASILVSASGLFAAVSVAYVVSGSGGEGRARTVAFVTWLLGHVALALSLRREHEPFTWGGLATNRVMAVWALVTLAFVVLAVSVPTLRAALKTTPLAPVDWALAFVAVAGGVLIVEWAKRRIPFDSSATTD
jgi:Ca2+-transporting ATPase